MKHLLKLASILLSFSLCLACLPVSNAAEANYPLGDVDFSGATDAHDLTVLARAVANIDLFTVQAYETDGNSVYSLGDLTFDGVLGASDLTALARHVGGVALLPDGWRIVLTLPENDNLAIRATASDGGYAQYDGGDIINVNDGDIITYWQNSNKDAVNAGTCFVQLDFGAPVTSNKSVFRFETGTKPTETGYQLLYSDDGTSWSPVPDVTAAYGDTMVLRYPELTARYLRLLITENVSDKYATKIGEWEVYESMTEDRTFVFLGSSVTYGSASGGRSFVEMIDENHSDLICVKLAVSGTTLADRDSSSYVSRLMTAAPDIPVCDCLVVQLSTNDASQNIPLGTVSSSFDAADFDKTTVLGAIETILAFAKETWDCPVYFYTGTKYNSTAYAAMVEGLYQVKDKWGIGIIDLYNDADMNAVSSEDYARYMSDPIHPTPVGYEEWWLPKFEAALFS